MVPGPPAYVYVTHEGLTEGDIDVALLELTWHIPAPCCVIVLPQYGGKDVPWPVHEG